MYGFFGGLRSFFVFCFFIYFFVKKPMYENGMLQYNTFRCLLFVSRVLGITGNGFTSCVARFQ